MSTPASFHLHSLHPSPPQSVSGFLVSDDQPPFQLHKIFGIIALFLIFIRVVMGLVGSRHSRFSTFPLHPRAVVEYLISAMVSKAKLYARSNPCLAMGAVPMFLLVTALFVSGIGYGSEEVEELHETVAWGLLAVVVLHLAGLAACRI